MEVYSIVDIYERCSEKYSLAKKEFCSLKDFYEIFQFSDRKMVINLMNVTCAEGDKIRPSELWEVIHKLDDSKIYDKGFLRDSNEFMSLSFFLSIFPEFYFKKLEGQNPDFILRDKGEEIGLEVTSTWSQVEGKVNEVARSTFGRNKETEEIQEYIRIKHPKLIDNIYLDSMNGVTVLSSSKGSVDCHAYKRDAVVPVARKKGEKTKNYYSQFQEMWLLIDTKDTPCFTDKHDAEELSKLFINEDSNLKPINKIIVINILHKAYMIYDVKRHEYEFIKAESRTV